MPPRSRPAIVEVFHGSFDPGFTGRSPIKNDSNKRKSEDQQQRAQRKRAREDCPAKHHEIGVLGRITGVSPPLNVSWDENGVEDFKAYVSKANEQTANWVAIQRKKLQTQSQTLFHAIDHDENASELEVGHHHHSSPPESLQDKELDHEKAKDVTNGV
ncbi:hypothetical protein MJO29_016127 [Puccinia striiformis f. sp. tritici]|nr:hypothetical protein MJO29_016127 [Puccinia striiformis f. sp. tritici]